MDENMSMKMKFEKNKTLKIWEKIKLKIKTFMWLLWMVLNLSARFRKKI